MLTERRRWRTPCCSGPPQHGQVSAVRIAYLDTARVFGEQATDEVTVETKSTRSLLNKRDRRPPEDSNYSLEAFGRHTENSMRSGNNTSRFRSQKPAISYDT
ncbi:hypothetical protein EYF80_049441 [Liparis tanakae]|uniref:Uncharacterized protein n=1 Tax=Liparis tanakae TaxID=230148 RepID=A0A4Z2FGS0_9TELE|nr:hypothetical protein EYF80_049441 [Liparis tanakae]